MKFIREKKLDSYSLPKFGCQLSWDSYTSYVANGPCSCTGPRNVRGKKNPLWVSFLWPHALLFLSSITLIWLCMCAPLSEVVRNSQISCYQILIFFNGRRQALENYSVFVIFTLCANMQVEHINEDKRLSYKHHISRKQLVQFSRLNPHPHLHPHSACDMPLYLKLSVLLLFV